MNTELQSWLNESVCVEQKVICFAHHKGLSCLFVSQFAEIAECVCSCLLMGKRKAVLITTNPHTLLTASERTSLTLFLWSASSAICTALYSSFYYLFTSSLYRHISQRAHPCRIEAECLQKYLNGATFPLWVQLWHLPYWCVCSQDWGASV